MNQKNDDDYADAPDEFKDPLVSSILFRLIITEI